MQITDLDNIEASDGKYYHFGEVLKEYTENFEKVAEKQKELREQLDDSYSTVIGISNVLDQFDAAWRDAKTGAWKSTAAYGEELASEHANGQNSWDKLPATLALDSGAFVDGNKTITATEGAVEITSESSSGLTKYSSKTKFALNNIQIIYLIQTQADKPALKIEFRTPVTQTIAKMGKQRLRHSPPICLSVKTSRTARCMLQSWNAFEPRTNLKS